MIFVSAPTVDESKQIRYPTNGQQSVSASAFGAGTAGQVQEPSVISYTQREEHCRVCLCNYMNT